MTWMGVEKVASVEPTAAAALRFMSSENSVVVLGGCNVPTGTKMLPVGPLVFNTPLVCVHPCTALPEADSRWPEASTWKLPARENSCAPVGSLSTKNPSPWTAASRIPELDCSAPWVNWRVVCGTPVPNPTWVSPRPAPSDSVTRSWNETALALNPVVLRLARLLPTTSMAVVLAFSADNAAENDVNGM